MSCLTDFAYFLEGKERKSLPPFDWYQDTIPGAGGPVSYMHCCMPGPPLQTHQDTARVEGQADAG